MRQYKIQPILEKIYTKTLDLIFPEAPQNYKITHLPFINQDTACIQCGKDLLSTRGLCLNCSQQRLKYLTSNISIFSYLYPVTEIIREVKFYHQGFKFKLLVQNFRKKELDLVENLCKQTDLISTIPVSKRRFKERGFNQSDLILKAIFKPIFKHKFKVLLEKTPHYAEQNKLGLDERLFRSDNPFSLLVEAYILIKHKKILLIDDIFTTGNTLEKAASVLIQHGAAEVRSLTLARAVK